MMASHGMTPHPVERVTVLTPVSLAHRISDKKCCLKRALVLLRMLHDRHCRERFEVRGALFAAFMSNRERMSKTRCSGDGERAESRTP
jgi:hypothetical protein